MPTWYWQGASDGSWDDETAWTDTYATGGTTIGISLGGSHGPWITGLDTTQSDDLKLGADAAGAPEIGAGLSIGLGFAITGVCDISSIGIYGLIYAGNFSGDNLVLDDPGCIYGGTFSGDNFDAGPDNAPTISGGVFSGDYFYNNNGYIGKDSGWRRPLFTGNNFANYGNIASGLFTGTGCYLSGTCDGDAVFVEDVTLDGAQLGAPYFGGTDAPVFLGTVTDNYAQIYRGYFSKSYTKNTGSLYGGMFNQRLTIGNGITAGAYDDHMLMVQGALYTTGGCAIYRGMFASCNEPHSLHAATDFGSQGVVLFCGPESSPLVLNATSVSQAYVIAHNCELQVTATVSTGSVLVGYSTFLISGSIDGSLVYGPGGIWRQGMALTVTTLVGNYYTGGFGTTLSTGNTVVGTYDSTAYSGIIAGAVIVGSGLANGNMTGGAVIGSFAMAVGTLSGGVITGAFSASSSCTVSGGTFAATASFGTGSTLTGGTYVGAVTLTNGTFTGTNCTFLSSLSLAASKTLSGGTFAGSTISVANGASITSGVTILKSTSTTLTGTGSCSARRPTDILGTGI